MEVFFLNQFSQALKNIDVKYEALGAKLKAERAKLKVEEAAMRERRAADRARLKQIVEDRNGANRYPE